MFYYSRNVFSQGRAAGHRGRRFESCRLACARAPNPQGWGLFLQAGVYHQELFDVLARSQRFANTGESVGHPSGWVRWLAIRSSGAT